MTEQHNGSHDVLTMEEIRNRFDSEWVLLGAPVTTQELEIIEGELLAHSPNRDEIDEALRETPTGARYAVFWVGDRPDNVILYHAF